MPAVVQALDFSGDLPRTVYRKREETLFAREEWSWSDRPEEAFEFPSYEQAEQHAEGLPHAFPVVRSNPEPVAVTEPPRRDRAHRRPIAPSQVFEDLERRGLA